MGVFVGAGVGVGVCVGVGVGVCVGVGVGVCVGVGVAVGGTGVAVAAAVRSTKNLYGPKPDSQLKVVILRV